VSLLSPLRDGHMANANYARQSLTLAETSTVGCSGWMLVVVALRSTSTSTVQEDKPVGVRRIRSCQRRICDTFVPPCFRRVSPQKKLKPRAEDVFPGSQSDTLAALAFVIRKDKATERDSPVRHNTMEMERLASGSSLHGSNWVSASCRRGVA